MKYVLLILINSLVVGFITYDLGKADGKKASHSSQGYERVTCLSSIKKVVNDFCINPKDYCNSEGK